MQNVIAQRKLGFIVGDFKVGLSKNFPALLEQETRKMEEKLRLDPKKFNKQSEF